MTHLRKLRTGALGAAVATALVLPATGVAADPAGNGGNETCAEDEVVLFDGEENGHIQGHQITEGAVFVEWPAILGDAAPGDRLEVAFADAAGGAARVARVRGFGRWAGALGSLSP